MVVIWSKMHSRCNFTYRIHFAIAGTIAATVAAISCSDECIVYATDKQA